MKTLVSIAIITLIGVLSTPPARSASVEGSNERSIEIISEAIKRNPKREWLYQKRGNVYLDMKKFDLAIADFTKAVTIKPRDPDTYIARADAYFEQGEYNKAVDDLDKAISLKPKYYLPYLKRAELYNYLGEKEAAIDSYKQVVRYNPKHALSYYVLGNYQLEQGQHNKALFNYNKAIANDAQMSEAHYARALVFYHKKEYAKSVDALNTARSLGFDESAAAILEQKVREASVAAARAKKRKNK
jgi:tetratricopeptide (TPR) repeat protein